MSDADRLAAIRQRHRERREGNDRGVCLYDGRGWPCPDYLDATAVFDALDAAEARADKADRLRRQAIEDAAAALVTHADHWAPVDGNFAQKRLRRHLLMASRVVANLNPLNRQLTAAALVAHLNEHETDGGC